jgi:branched-chain amino acid transport system permease protein
MALQLLFNALSLGAAYALVALGFVLIINATSAVNFSQGDMVMLGGFASVTLAQWLNLPGIVLMPIVLIGMAALGILFSAVAYFPLQHRPPETVFISTIAMGIVLQNLANILFGPEPKAAPALVGTSELAFGPVTVSRQALAILFTAALLILALYGLFTRTQFGRRLRATAQDREMASAIGIPVTAMIAGTFALATALAGAAGLLLSNTFFVTPTEGNNYIIKAYIATTVGGWGSIPGAVAGACLIALFEVIYPALPVIFQHLGGREVSSILFSQTTSTILLDIVILVILFVRPQGLFGEAVRIRA